jgi:hypothetical protein
MAEPHDKLVLALHDLAEQLDARPPAAADPVMAAVGRIRARQLTEAGDGSGTSAVTVMGGIGRSGVRSRAQDRSRRLVRHRRVAVAAAVALLVGLVATLATSGSRQAVARWLGIGSVALTYRDEVPAGAGRRFDLGTPVPLEVAAEIAPRPLRAPAGVGAPAQAFVGRPAGSVTLVWAPSAALPEVDRSGIGLLLSALPGSTDAGQVSKQIGPGTSVELVRMADAPAYWIAGARHAVLVIGPDGQPVTDTTRLAGNTLIWTDGAITYRLESALGRDDAVELAASLRELGARSPAAARGAEPLRSR